jgi:hypothetical protein
MASTEPAGTSASAPSAPLDLDALIASIPADPTPLREKLRRELEVVFAWDYRDEEKVFIAQLGFQRHLRDTDLIALAGLPSPLVLMLNNTPISDTGLALLARLCKPQENQKPLVGEIWELHLGYTQVGDEGLAHLTAMPSLRTLDLTKTGTTDAGLVHVAKLTHLRRLILARTQVQGPGLPQLRSLADLMELDLEGTPVNDDGLFQLPALPHLRKLVLRGTRITDAGLARLKDLPALEELDITRTRITDACVSHLKELKKLRRLRIVDKTGLTERGAIQLRLALPETVVID